MNIAVFGLGKLGAPMVAVFASKGHNVIGVDPSSEAVSKLGRGTSPLGEPGLQKLMSANAERIHTASTLAAVLQSKLIFVVVPTPSMSDGGFSLAYVLGAMEMIGEALAADGTFRVIVLTSTVTPGSMDKYVVPALEQASGKKAGEDFGVCYGPEFIALGSVIHDMQNPDLILIGESDSIAGDVLEDFCKSICNRGTVSRMNFVNAELTKLAINTYVTTKISYANMIGELCDQLPGANARVVTAAVGLDSRIGQKYLRPATAYGGPCFPRDNKALAALARSLGVSPDLSEATDRINNRQAKRLANLVHSHLRTTGVVGVLGLTYKTDTHVVDKSASLALIRELALRDIETVAYDPMVSDVANAVRLGDMMSDCTREADVLVIMVPWPEFRDIDPADFLDGPTTVIDCWGILEGNRVIRELCQYVIPGRNV